jgi:hypothetical protein
MKHTTLLRLALPAAMFVLAPTLPAQTDTSTSSQPPKTRTQPPKTKTKTKTQPPVVRDSAAGTLADKVDSVDTAAQFGQLLASLNTLDTNTARFNAITGLTPEHITLVDVRNLLQGENQVALDNALGRNERQITTMRSDLQSSTVLRDLLVARSIPMSQIIAVDVAPDATKATVYYRPQE